MVEDTSESTTQILSIYPSLIISDRNRILSRYTWCRFSISSIASYVLLSWPYKLNCEIFGKTSKILTSWKSYLAAAYQTGFGGENLTHEVAHHSAHCFDYLRQSILCAADTSLEGKTEAGPGWGSKHQCKDYDAVLAWANERTVVKFRTNMPTEAVLWN